MGPEGTPPTAPMTVALLLEGGFDDSALVHLKSTLLRQDRLEA
jgi:hypothetical protein